MKSPGLYQSVGPGERPSVLILRLRTEVERIAVEPGSSDFGYVTADPDDLQSRRGLARAEHSLGNELEATHQIQAYLAARGDELRAWCDWLEMLHGRGDITAWPPPSSNCRPPRLRMAGSGPSVALSVWLAVTSQRPRTPYRRAATLRPHDEQISIGWRLWSDKPVMATRPKPTWPQQGTLREAPNGLLDALQVYSRVVRPDQAPKPEMVNATASPGLALPDARPGPRGPSTGRLLVPDCSSELRAARSISAVASRACPCVP